MVHSNKFLRVSQVAIYTFLNKQRLIKFFIGFLRSLMNSVQKYKRCILPLDHVELTKKQTTREEKSKFAQIYPN